jgi:hypothetical protein
MGKLIYSTPASADGYIEDAGGSFDWTAPDDEVFRFVRTFCVRSAPTCVNHPGQRIGSMPAARIGRTVRR